MDAIIQVTINRYNHYNQVIIIYLSFHTIWKCVDLNVIEMLSVSPWVALWHFDTSSFWLNAFSWDYYIKSMKLIQKDKKQKKLTKLDKDG